MRRSRASARVVFARASVAARGHGADCAEEDKRGQGAHKRAATLSGASSSSCTGKRCSFTSWTCARAHAGVAFN